jgi:hypothetical protein
MTDQPSLTDPEINQQLRQHCPSCGHHAQLLSDPQLAVAQYALLFIARHQLPFTHFDRFRHHIQEQLDMEPEMGTMI